MNLVDLHTHTFYSDGVLSPSELVYRYKTRGCKAMAITDHVDYSNIESTIESIKKTTEKLEKYYDIIVLAGVELTYIPPEDLPNMISEARKIGAEIVLVHGETTAESVPPGTNQAAVSGKCDILAHPGHLINEVAAIAKHNDVCIELTTRDGHCDTNKEVFNVAMQNKCDIVLNTDTHTPDDLLDSIKINKILHHCDIAYIYYDTFYRNSMKLVKKIKEK